MILRRIYGSYLDKNVFYCLEKSLTGVDASGHEVADDEAEQRDKVRERRTAIIRFLDKQSDVELVLRAEPRSAAVASNALRNSRHFFLLPLWMASSLLSKILGSPGVAVAAVAAAGVEFGFGSAVASVPAMAVAEGLLVFVLSVVQLLPAQRLSSLQTSGCS